MWLFYLIQKAFLQKIYGPKVFVERDRITYHAEFQEVAFTRYLYCSSPRFLPCPTFGNYCRKLPRQSRRVVWCPYRLPWKFFSLFENWGLRYCKSCFTFFEPCIMIYSYICNKNQQNAHFFINDLFQLYFLRHVANNQVFILKKTCTCRFMVFFHTEIIINT